MHSKYILLILLLSIIGISPLKANEGVSSQWQPDEKVILKKAEKIFREKPLSFKQVAETDSISILHFRDSETRPLGYAAHVITKGRFHIFRFVIMYNTKAELENIVILHYPETRGRAALSKRYLKKFRGIHADDGVKAEDFDIASGASYTSEAIINSVLNSARMLNDIITED